MKNSLNLNFQLGESHHIRGIWIKAHRKIAHLQAINKKAKSTQNTIEDDHKKIV